MHYIEDAMRNCGTVGNLHVDTPPCRCGAIEDLGSSVVNASVRRAVRHLCTFRPEERFGDRMSELKPNADAQTLFEKLTGKSPPSQTFDVREHLERWSSGRCPAGTTISPDQTPGSSPTATAATPALK